MLFLRTKRNLWKYSRQDPELLWGCGTGTAGTSIRRRCTFRYMLLAAEAASMIELRYEAMRCNEPYLCQPAIAFEMYFCLSPGWGRS